MCLNTNKDVTYLFSVQAVIGLASLSLTQSQRGILRQPPTLVFCGVLGLWETCPNELAMALGLEMA
jgi:hypothetical protein